MLLTIQFENKLDIYWLQDKRFRSQCKARMSTLCIKSLQLVLLENPSLTIYGRILIHRCTFFVEGKHVILFCRTLTWTQRKPSSSQSRMSNGLINSFYCLNNEMITTFFFRFAVVYYMCSFLQGELYRTLTAKKLMRTYKMFLFLQNPITTNNRTQASIQPAKQLKSKAI